MLKIVNFINKRLVRLINVTVEQWLYLKYGDHMMVSNEVKESVIATWLIRSYKKQFDEYMEIKKQKEVYGLDANMEYDPSNVYFDEWLALKIEQRRFHGWQICHGNVMRLDEPSDNIEHVFQAISVQRIDMLRGSLAMKKGTILQCYEWYENLEEGELKDEALNSKSIFEGIKRGYEESSDNARTHCSPIDEWEDFERANHIGSDANSNYNPYLDVSRIFNDRAGTNNDYETRENKGWFDEHELIKDDNDDDIDDLEHYLIRKDNLYYVNEEEERSKERRCKLLGIPYVKPPT
ncbi:hypothetical protein Tco_0571038 [Tanacetum coccineum]